MIKKDRETTKVRIVFDAAARGKYGCLNDYIETGPKLQNDIVDVLLRFRKHAIALVCDISEMYLQIGIHEDDRKYLRFLWKDRDDLKTFEFNRVVFGLNTSPFLAQLVSRENARLYEKEFPRASESVYESTYMDDTLDSVESVEEGKTLRIDIEKLWSKAGMKVCKWMSNSEEVLAEIPIENRSKNLEIEDEGSCATKTLGITWNSKTDVFEFHVKLFSEVKITKRNLLSWVARIFDPLGMISPYTISGKMFIQKAWMAGVDWDEPLERSLTNKIERWFQDADKIELIKVPRLLIKTATEEAELHVFSDASSEGYGAVVYLRSMDGGKWDTSFVVGKGKVVPIKSISIPRLELMAACLGVKLLTRVIKPLGITMEKVTFWEDSMDVLWWIKQQSRQLKPFVANRIGEI